MDEYGGSKLSIGASFDLADVEDDSIGTDTNNNDQLKSEVDEYLRT
jgi:hypothetical protein